MNECSIFNSSETVEYTYPQKNDVLIKKPSDYSSLSMVRQSNNLKEILIPEGYYTIAIDALIKAQNSNNNITKVFVYSCVSISSKLNGRKVMRKYMRIAEKIKI